VRHRRARRSRRAVAPAILATIAVAAVAGALLTPQPAAPAGSAAAAGRPALRLQTAVLSLRRLPALVTRTAGLLRLGPALNAALADPRLAAAGQESCLIVQQGPTVLYSLRPTLPLIPASNLKLLTATAALDRLGPSARLATDVKADRAPAGGTITGNLYLVGGGDPLLRTADYIATLRYRELNYNHLDGLAAQVRAAGVSHVTGGVIGDESRYDTQRYVPTWKPSYAATGEVGPLSALEVNDGFQSFRPNDVPAAQPAVQAATEFATALRAHGVAIDGPPGQGVTPPAAAAITSLPSLPLVDTVAEVLRQSDNTGAELLTKELGRRFGGGATTSAGVQVTRSDLQADGLPVGPLTAVDGSGLDRGDRASCQLIMAALVRSGPQGPLSKGLSLAGQTGTLEKRMVATPAAGRLRAKTGSLTGVSALSGFVDPAGPVTAGAVTAGAAGPLSVAFTLVINGQPSQAVGEGLEDRIGVILAQYPQAPPADQLAPLPALPAQPARTPPSAKPSR
jgi:serine-type D-Ala-D-Ala carboxypeptidase/endopeptidase (penicillin-binding protein 4)